MSISSSSSPPDPFEEEAMALLKQVINAYRGLHPTGLEGALIERIREGVRTRNWAMVLATAETLRDMFGRIPGTAKPKPQGGGLPDQRAIDARRRIPTLGSGKRPIKEVAKEAYETIQQAYSNEHMRRTLWEAKMLIRIDEAMEQENFQAALEMMSELSRRHPRAAGGGSRVQAVLFNKSKWDLARAKKWLTRAGFSFDKVDTTEAFLRFRQADPQGFKRFVTRKVKNGINLVIGLD